MAGTAEASNPESCVASAIRSAISRTGKPCPASHSTTNGVSTKRRRPVGLRPELDEHDGQVLRVRVPNELVVRRNRIAGDDVHEHLGIRSRLSRSDDDGPRGGTRTELLRELLRQDAADDDRPRTRRRNLLHERLAQTSQLTHDAP